MQHHHLLLHHHLLPLPVPIRPLTITVLPLAPNSPCPTDACTSHAVSPPLHDHTSARTTGTPHGPGNSLTI
ncbi:uncharacterized protein CANTADRAFT_89126 [Suhomyces tanzawaensis NRRL Y-17324]|uniref:Uncharacterized protein n=1 Tax=Suhomyces tanzawaensis NRRL Y-17324 TaxID=984487 RepID=A0A1E4SP03_9ASCO|nr:uncharacterized protein CANTADRAFT_89126 [Suhomyces tanzawaensis NRRL Y-17324]ODV81243.1 hypothetical protein CANTADRAFT_89126 [Suhomyces tanzawaensis NRRL Y-17324]